MLALPEQRYSWSNHANIRLAEVKRFGEARGPTKHGDSMEMGHELKGKGVVTRKAKKRPDKDETATFGRA